MSKKLQVREPQTADGTTLRYDDNKQVVYKTTIVELGSRKVYESLNAKRKEHLKYELTEVEVEDKKTGSSSNEALKKKLAELETESENRELREKIASLEARLAGDGETAGVESDADAAAKEKGKPGPKPKVAATEVGAANTQA